MAFSGNIILCNKRRIALASKKGPPQPGIGWQEGRVRFQINSDLILKFRFDPQKQIGHKITEQSWMENPNSSHHLGEMVKVGTAFSLGCSIEFVKHLKFPMSRPTIYGAEAGEIYKKDRKEKVQAIRLPD
ncbi:Uncharacterized protein Fot_37521 [Forsythia ovata]|uniref:Uncharacterized protein n=1 Tax=Forsythia ovata TaxID=205694 RepID=A0ABD1S3C2_9LAMI